MLVALAACTSRAPSSPAFRGGAPPSCATGMMIDNAGTGYPDLQTALDASVEGDTLTVCPGRWLQTSKAVHRSGHEIHITGSTDVAEDTIIEGDGTNRIFESAHQIGDIYIENIEIQDVNSGFFVDGNQTSLAFVRNVNIKYAFSRSFDPTITLWGMKFIEVEGLTVLDSSIPGEFHATDAFTMANSTFSNNLFFLYVTSGRNGSHPHITISDCTFEHTATNALRAGNDFTGGADVHIERVVFRDNGGHLDDDLAPWNEPAATGGLIITGSRIYSGEAYNVTISDSAFEDNIGDAGAHLFLNELHPDDTLTVNISNTSFLRGRPSAHQGPSETWQRDPQRWGRVLEYGVIARDDYTLDLRLDNVDLGTGPDRPLGPAFPFCDQDYEGVISGRILLPGAPEAHCP